MKIAAAVFTVLYLLQSCAANTPTNAPDSHLPAIYRGADSSGAASLADIPWQKFYDDPVLQKLIAQALEKNNTVAEAYAAVLEARANLGITAGNQQPQGGLTLQAPFANTFGNRSGVSASTEFGPAATANVSYTIDLFGKLASATAAARAQLLSTVAAQETVRWTLVSQVASSYFQLLELKTALDITQRTIVTRKENLRLTKLRVDLGENSIQDQYQSEQALYETTEQLPLITQSIAATENALSVLTGEYPHAILTGPSLDKQVAMPQVPATGLPGALLERRPDVIQAEYSLVAADANIDVARKMFYPSLTLGAGLGVSGSLVNGINLPFYLAPLAPNGSWVGPTGLLEILPQLTQTLFSGGKLQANVALARAQQQQLTYSYLQTVLTAYQEVSTDVVAYNQQRAYYRQAALYAQSSDNALKVANELYEQGEVAYLYVLNAATRDYQAEIALEQARLNERLALVQLYLSLGGGWQS